MSAPETPATREEVARHLYGAVLEDGLPAPVEISVSVRYANATLSLASVDDLRVWAAWLGAEGIAASPRTSTGFIHHTVDATWRGRRIGAYFLEKVEVPS